MSREKIKVPGKVYDELVALQREIHFTQDHADTIIQRRTISRKESPLQPKSSKKSGGFFAGIRNWLGKYF